MSAPVDALEEPAFDLIDEVDGLEIRRYRAHVVARTLVKESLQKSGNEGFKRLGGYIFGGNDKEQRIAMTAPVAMEPNQDANREWWVTFSMPRQHMKDNLPGPNDPRVEIIELQERILAVLRYKGNWSEKRFRKHESALLSLIDQSSTWSKKGQTIWSRYNSPIVPGFLRTNEVAIEVVPASVPGR